MSVSLSRRLTLLTVSLSFSGKSLWQLCKEQQRNDCLKILTRHVVRCAADHLSATTTVATPSLFGFIGGVDVADGDYDYDHESAADDDVTVVGQRAARRQQQQQLMWREEKQTTDTSTDDEPTVVAAPQSSSSSKRASVAAPSPEGRGLSRSSHTLVVKAEKERWARETRAWFGQGGAGGGGGVLEAASSVADVV